MSSQNGTVEKKKTTSTAKVSTSTKTAIKIAAKEVLKESVNAKIPSQAEIIKTRMDKRTKLSTLYKDIDALEKAQTDFDSIQKFSDIRIVVYSGQTPTFSTTRQDTVNDVLGTIKTNISQKLGIAQKELAEFEF